MDMADHGREKSNVLANRLIVASISKAYPEITKRKWK